MSEDKITQEKQSIADCKSNVKVGKEQLYLTKAMTFILQPWITLTMENKVAALRKDCKRLIESFMLKLRVLSITYIFNTICSQLSIVILSSVLS